MVLSLQLSDDLLVIEPNITLIQHFQNLPLPEDDRQVEPRRFLSLQPNHKDGGAIRKTPTLVRLSLTVPAFPRTSRSARSQSVSGDPFRKALPSQNS
jgi:hypothetical protein